MVGFEAITEVDARVTAPERASAGRTGSRWSRRRWKSWPRAATRKPSPTRSSIRRCRAKLFPGVTTPVLSNPISSDMAVMRASLWPGLIKAALENQRRQQDRIRLFEHGARFEHDSMEAVETDLLAGIAMGSRRPEQWGAKATARGFLRREAGPGGAVRAQRRVRTSSATSPTASPACIPAAVRESRAAARPSAGSANCTPNWCRSSISHMHRFCSKSNTFRLCPQTCRVLKRSPASRAYVATWPWSLMRKCLCDNYMNV